MMTKPEMMKMMKRKKRKRITRIKMMMKNSMKGRTLPFTIFARSQNMLEWHFTSTRRVFIFHE